MLKSIEGHLRARERRRDDLAEEARRVRRAAQSTVQKLHQGLDVDRETRELRSGMRGLERRVAHGGGRDAGLVHDAVQEAVEAVLLERLVRHRPFPSPTALGVAPELYLSGVADLVGELRRLVLARLSSGDLGEAERYLAEMERIHHSLMRFETPRAIVQLKPKQDTSRALLERTRGEVTLARLLARAHLPSERIVSGEP